MYDKHIQKRDPRILSYSMQALERWSSLKWNIYSSKLLMGFPWQGKQRNTMVERKSSVWAMAVKYTYYNRTTNNMCVSVSVVASIPSNLLVCKFETPENNSPIEVVIATVCSCCPRHPGCIPKEFKEEFIITFWVTMGPWKASVGDNVQTGLCSICGCTLSWRFCLLWAWYDIISLTMTLHCLKDFSPLIQFQLQTIHITYSKIPYRLYLLQWLKWLDYMCTMCQATAVIFSGQDHVQKVISRAESHIFPRS